MESQQSQAWFDIADKVDALLALPGARERFRERLEEAAADWLCRSDEKQKGEKARHELAYRAGVPHAPLFDADRQSEKAGTNCENSFQWVGYIQDPSEPSHTFPWQARLPAELSPDLDPDDSLPVPIPDRVVSLAERYAALAAVWDVYWKGDEKIGPWHIRDQKPALMEREEFKRSLQGSGPYYLWLTCEIEHTKGDAPTNRLDETDRAIVETWLADVEADRLPEMNGVDGSVTGGADDREKQIESLTPLGKLCVQALRHFEKPISDTSLQTLAGLSHTQKFNLVCWFWKDAKGLTPLPLRKQFVQAVGKKDYPLPDDKSGTNRVRVGIQRGQTVLSKF